MKRYILFILLLAACFCAEAQNRLSGKIIAARDSLGLPGVSIRVKGTTLGTSTAADGSFSFTIPAREVMLEVFYIGYLKKELPVILPLNRALLIALEEDAAELQEVVVSTGYQEIPKERATGSFVQLDNKLLNRSVSTDILSRLQDVVPGLVFNRDSRGDTEPISIRGRSTILSASSPLIVIDNFPWEGDINTLNPNDVESITVLKDAAAASIWGARSGNGVIVITTKKGNYKQPASISLNSNFNLSARPDLFYQPALTTADYIETEKRLFAGGFYKSAEASLVKAPLTPVVELLIAKRDGLLTAAEADAQIEALKNRDVRNDYRDELYREALYQQYALSIRGGSESQKYFVSGGYDRNLSSRMGDTYQRVTLNAGNTYALFKNRLELSAAVYYTGSNARNNAVDTRDLYMSPTQPLYPYARFKADDGTHLATIKTYRSGFVQQAGAMGLPDWQYRPLDEAGLNDNSTRLSETRISTGLKYSFSTGLKAELLYQYSQGINELRDHNSPESYYARDMINNLTEINANGSFTRPIPAGGILDRNSGRSMSHDLRAQLNYNKIWNKNSLAILAGSELRDRNTNGAGSRLYGYDEDHASSALADHISSFKRFVYPGQLMTIPALNSQSDLSDRFLSYYSNGSYTYHSRYTLSLSGRLDRSNLFGVSANQKGVPLYSAGLSWNLSDEGFYKIAWLPYLKLRLTYGYNGNVNKDVSAYTTASYNNGNSALTRQPYAIVQNPPNADLRWERVRIINSGIDFSAFSGILSGSLEYYRKTGIDLIGSSPFPPSSGISSFTGNYANTRGEGVDIMLRTRNRNGKVQWSTDYLFSYSRDEVSAYELKGTALSFLENTGGPLVGKPLYALYSYEWDGLDPQTGDPMGYLNGNPSKDYTAMRTVATPENLRYHGSSRPQIYGALRNTLAWKDLRVSANISYRLGYYFRRGSIRYASDQGLASGHGDYALRWQKSGDELITAVPSVPAAANTNRDNFYRLSSILVEKGDHLRFNDISMAYTFRKEVFRKLPLKSVELYLYANNLGVLWKATKSGFDPDYPLAVSAPARSVAFGLRAGL